MRVPFTAAVIMLTSASLAHAQAGACPSQEFEKFLEAYGESEDLQKQFTRFPLSVSFVVERDEIAREPVVVSTLLAMDNAVYPLMPSASTQEEQKLAHEIEESGNERIVHYVKPDTDYQFDLHFAKTRGCWQLIKKYDASL